MEKWEFCYVDLMYNKLAHFTDLGLLETKFKRDKAVEGDSKSAATGRAVAQLGREGWELVNGFGDIQKILYFKRRKP
jgi:hypothetical protein